MNEFALIRRFFDRPAKSALVGVGDDCALVRPDAGLELAMTTDMLVEGRHFAAGAEPRALGHKCLAVNLSDLAAVGATPRWILLALALPRAEEAWLAEFAAGLFALAERYGVELLGGDTVRAPLTTITVTAIGEVPAGVALYRAGARAGDDIWVSGELGGAALSLKDPQLTEVRDRLHRPQPRVELGERLRGLAHSAIDVSDGLVSDLGHILERSHVGAVVRYGDIPRPAALALADADTQRACVLSGGDDYELAFTAAPSRRQEIAALGGELGLPLTRIGEIQKDGPLRVLDADGKPLAWQPGFDHFK